MILLLLLAIVSVVAVVATVHEVRVDGYRAIPTDPRRLPN